MDGDVGGWLWLVIDVIFVAALAGALIYGTVMWRRRSRNPVLEQARDEATRRLYEEKPLDERNRPAA
jgi:uncharacterized iron-regulated membrane protein